MMVYSCFYVSINSKSDKNQEKGEQEKQEKQNNQVVYSFPSSSNTHPQFPLRIRKFINLINCW